MIVDLINRDVTQKWLDLDDLVALCKNDCMFSELRNAKLTLEYGK